MNRPRLGSALVAGAALGVGQLAKFTLLVLYPVQLTIPLLGFFRRRDGAGQRARAVAGHALTALAVCLLVLNAGYGFEKRLRPLHRYDFQSDLFKQLAGFVPEQLSRYLYMPLPARYIEGINEQQVDFDHSLVPYLGGELRQRGGWYYYLYGMLVKIPLGTWALILIATLGKLVCRGGSRPLAR